MKKTNGKLKQKRNTFINEIMKSMDLPLMNLSPHSLTPEKNNINILLAKNTDINGQANIQKVRNTADKTLSVLS